MTISSKYIIVYLFLEKKILKTLLLNMGQSTKFFFQKITKLGINEFGLIKNNRKSKGYAFVEFESSSAANSSLDFNGDIVGRSIVISLAKNKRKTPDEMRKRDR